MYTNANDITKITPPPTLAELAALDATREVPYLKARCNRMGIHVPGPNPTPTEIIPHLQRVLAAQLKDPARDAGLMSGDYMEWKLIREEYEEFIAYLQSLATRPSPTPKPAPTNPVNLVNPVQNSDSTDRHETGSKPNQNRTDFEPSAQPPCKPTFPIEPKSNRNRIKIGSNPARFRTIGPKSFKTGRKPTKRSARNRPRRLSRAD